MKLIGQYVLRRVAGVTAAVSVGREPELLCSLNESGELLFRKLQAGADRKMLTDALLECYTVSAEQAEADVDSFLNTLRSKGMLE